jgi:hypothetical protein
MLRKFNYLALGIIGVALLYEYASPAVALYKYGNDYKTLMYECDHAMREHFIAKKTVEAKPAKVSIANLEASEVGLLACHQYDLLRKRMQRFNVSDAGLETLGLQALEEKEFELRAFVKTHEIRY